MTFTLTAEDLASKWGFADGDLFFDFLWDHDLGDVDKHRVLVEAVRRYLLPLLPGVQVYEIETIHNPIRTEDTIPGDDVAVTIEDDQVLTIARAFQ